MKPDSIPGDVEPGDNHASMPVPCPARRGRNPAAEQAELGIGADPGRQSFSNLSRSVCSNTTLVFRKVSGTAVQLTLRVFLLRSVVCMI